MIFSVVFPIVFVFVVGFSFLLVPVLVGFVAPIDVLVVVISPLFVGLVHLLNETFENMDGIVVVLVQGVVMLGDQIVEFFLEVFQLLQGKSGLRKGELDVVFHDVNLGLGGESDGAESGK